MTDHLLYKGTLRCYSDIELAQAFADVITERMYPLEDQDENYLDDLELVRILMAEEINHRKNN